MAKNNGKKQNKMIKNESETVNKESVFNRIHKNYDDLNRKMVEEMNLASEHDGLTGNYREEMWIQFFRSIIPQKFSLAQGVMIIDSKGNVSKEVDIAVFDEQYTPYVFQYNTLKFIPIEAVALVIECKSVSLNPENLRDWATSIDGLCTCQSGIARMVSGYATGLTNSTQKSTRPIKILACIKQTVTEEPLENIKEKLGDHFDFIIQEKKNTDNELNRFAVIVKHADKSLGWWGKQLNEGASKDVCDDKLHLYGFPDSRHPKDEQEKIRLKQEIEQKKLEIQRDYQELKFSDDPDAFLLENTLDDLKVEDNPFLSLNLQLNQLLILFNNPMLFPHFAYAKRFNEIIAKETKKTKNKSSKKRTQ